MASLVSLGAFAGGLGGSLQAGFAAREREKGERGRLREQEKSREAKARSDALTARRSFRTTHFTELEQAIELGSKAVRDGQPGIADQIFASVRSGFKDLSAAAKRDGDPLPISNTLLEARIKEGQAGLGPAAALEKKTAEAGAVAESEAAGTAAGKFVEPKVRAARTIEETTALLDREPTAQERVRLAGVAPSDAAASKALLDDAGNVKPAVSNSIRQFTAQLFGGVFSPETGNFSLLDADDSKRALELGAAAEALIAGGHEHSIAAAVDRAAKARGIGFPLTKLEQDDLVAEAERAVARGAGRKAVAERLEQEGVEKKRARSFAKDK